MLRSGRGSSPFLLLFGLLLFLQIASLPINPGFLFLNSRATPITLNCEKKTCCTPLCYVDENGKHHCVHVIDGSREDGIAAGEVQPGSLLVSIVARMPGAGLSLPALNLAGWISLTPGPVRTFDTAPPTPPPKSL